MRLHSIESDPEYINLQTEFVWMQQWIHKNNKRLLIIFEGRDTAGKGGAIMRFVRYLNPRYFNIVALTKPTDIEKGQWYFQRYIQHLPNPGFISLFDRSWYNRAVVEPVMGFCNNEQHELFMAQVVQLEKMLIEDGLNIIKFWFSIANYEQKKRLDERHTNPLKRWKLSTVDAQAQAKWRDYTHFKNNMFSTTSTAHCPWVDIEGNHKSSARKEAMRYVLSQFDYENKGDTGERLTADPDILTLVPIIN